ncbi:unnamed protein product [Caenorhabditis auriculariae]|uniref:DNA repair and recombination protein RAD54-like n=1 Tax=Caenorhabditis auriculariae TaxID=2777116 RepID=A0A8S1HW43_9PELO|nr:unnamed protein product [Caenorhabditis auriculariae]
MPIRGYEFENSDGAASEKEGEECARFSVLYAKASTRKHKIWEGDGLLVCYSSFAVLKSEDEKDVICRSTSLKKIEDLEEGKSIFMGGWEVQIQQRLFVAPGTISSTPKTLPPPQVRLSSTPDSRKRPSIEKIVGAKRIQSKSTFVSPVCGSYEVVKVSLSPPFIINEDEVAEQSVPPIFADPKFTKFLRDHQKDGVRFIYQRLKNEGGGAILADEMGLGKKVFKTIAATWALLKNKQLNLSKCLLVVPSSLVNNWQFEFKKWFRNDRLPAMRMQKTKDLKTFAVSANYNPYLIISYDMALRYQKELASLKFDMIVCDEGHRLKNSAGKLRKALMSLEIPRRLILTGTPMQNDLTEFHSLLDFVVPNEFGTAAEFREMCTNKEFELNEKTSKCMLRRTSDVNNAHLPPKHEFVLFCKPSPLQRKLHLDITDRVTGDPLSSSTKNSSRSASQENSKQEYLGILDSYPKGYDPRSATSTDSGKLSVLLSMIASFRKLEESTVIVSNSTMTLNMVEMLIRALGFRVFRLDGSTPVSERQKLVAKFNESCCPDNVFLLSTKAGGVGLNLTGASRLVLFDSDWNPANDVQAMARIWRDGQTKPCHIYRLIATGTIDEKIIQRQIKKTGLGAVIDLLEMKECANIKDEDLDDIFNVPDTECETHDLCECPCDGRGLLITEKDEEEEEHDEEGKEEEEEEEVKDSEESQGEEPSESTPDIFEAPEDGEAEPTEKEVEAKIEKDSKRVSMAELSRWRHFSPRHPATWDYFVEKAGLKAKKEDDDEEEEENELTFAFYLSSNF